MRLAVVSLLILVLVGCPRPVNPPASLDLGDGAARVHVDLEPFVLTVRGAGGATVLSTLPGQQDDPYGGPAFTVDTPEFKEQLLPGWDGYTPHESPWVHGVNASIRSHEGNRATIEMPVARATIVLEISVAGRRVHLLQRVEHAPDVATFDQFNKATLSFALPSDEHFFGMGERYASVDHRGLSLYSWAEEAGVGTGEDTEVGPQNPYPNGPSMTYFPVPFFLSSRGYAMHLATTFRTVVHFGSERQDALRIAANDATLPVTIYVDPDPIEQLSLYTEDSGRPVVPAPWAWGNRRRIGVNALQEGVPEWQLMRNRNMPLTAIDDAVHFLPHRSELGRESELTEWTNTLHANGLKALCYYNPYISASRPTAAEDFAYGRDNGLFIKALDGTPALTFFISGTPQEIAAIDLTNDVAVAWFQSLLSRAVALGYDGWMHDFGEYTARESVAADGLYGDEIHNLFPVLSAKAAHDFFEREKPDDYLFFVRSGFAGTQAYAPAVWSGDPEGSFDETQGVPSQVRAGVNLGMSGVPYFGPDMGGYKCMNDVERNKELYFRWLQLSALSPIMMDQNRCTDVVGEREKWTIWSDEETWREYARYASLHIRMQPYLRVLAEDAHARGIPIMRHPFLMYPREPQTWSVDDTYFFGPALFVAPVVRRGQTLKETWLPPGRYVDLDDFTVYTGGAQVSIPAPINKLPLLLVEGHLLPLLDDEVQTLAPATEPSVITADSRADRLDVRVALGALGRAELTLVDGTTLRAEVLAEDAGNPAGLEDATAIKDCARCFLRSTVGDVDRVQINTAPVASDEVTIGDVMVSFEGGPARRVRFDVMRLR